MSSLSRERNILLVFNENTIFKTRFSSAAALFGLFPLIFHERFNPKYIFEFLFLAEF